MHPSDIVIEQIIALLGRPLHADLLDGCRVILMLVDPFLQACRKIRAGCQISHSLHRGQARDRHDARDLRETDAVEITLFTPVVEHTIVEEHLSGDPVRTRLDLGLEVVHLAKSIRCFGMTLRKACDADSETSLVRVRPRFVSTANGSDEIDGMRECFGVRIVLITAFRGIAPNDEDVADAMRLVSGQDVLQLLRSLLNTGEMRDRIKTTVALERHHQIMCPLASGSARSVRDGDE